MDAISNIGNIFNNPGLKNLIGLGTAGAGTIGNLFASMKRNQVLNQSLNNQKQLMDLANNPGLVASNAAKLQQPLSAGLTSGVGNAVQAYLAERGLSQAPGIQSETLAQGLAPYQLQEQQMAMNAYLQSLGLPAGATPRFLPYPQSTDLSKIFQSLFQNPTAGNQPSQQTPQQVMAWINSQNQPMQPGVNPNQLPADYGTPPDVGNGGNFGGSGGNFDWMSMMGMTPGLT